MYEYMDVRYVLGPPAKCATCNPGGVAVAVEWSAPVGRRHAHLADRLPLTFCGGSVVELVVENYEFSTIS